MSTTNNTAPPKPSRLRALADNAIAALFCIATGVFFGAIAYLLDWSSTLWSN
ncbi:hypothetical protein [Nocardia flavorosea]|uniref:Uncharacterized protein n=1 Tax=Nocardia flavorosea TaxID=53429 RepID=A0A846YT02_9NOCA|nr:hypothetical protein [Nocardia flavorosea]NKY60801.1 hypothetical protein [Nocardia flavorosea]